jgi:carboxyl-terminal processing protease
VSLNEAVRKKEIQDAEAKKANNDKLSSKLIDKETGRTQDLLKEDDEYLREGLLVLSDLINSKIG